MNRPSKTYKTLFGLCVFDNRIMSQKEKLLKEMNLLRLMTMKTQSQKAAPDKDLLIGRLAGVVKGITQKVYSYVLLLFYLSVCLSTYLF